ncbi:hypothetical protein ACFODW_01650 [Virgibacillus sediminis]|uniref:Transposase n=1 Tax=Virgibacillus sediminis TaxID=202260 RepID=A0ABV7A2C4_9BACI
MSVYKKHGAAGLNRKTIKEAYSVQFKMDVLNFMKRTGASVAETALQFGLTNPNDYYLEEGILRRWRRSPKPKERTAIHV